MQSIAEQAYSPVTCLNWPFCPVFSYASSFPNHFRPFPLPVSFSFKNLIISLIVSPNNPLAPWVPGPSRQQPPSFCKVVWRVLPIDSSCWVSHPENGGWSVPCDSPERMLLLSCSVIQSICTLLGRSNVGKFSLLVHLKSFWSYGFCVYLLHAVTSSSYDDAHTCRKFSVCMGQVVWVVLLPCSCICKNLCLLVLSSSALER